MIPKRAISILQNSDLPDIVKDRFIKNISINKNIQIPLGILKNIVFGQRTFDMGEVVGYNVRGGILDLERIGVFPVIYIREANDYDLLRVINAENNWRSFDVINPQLYGSMSKS